MRQIGGENDDPLKRIQEEINEVKKRELELRNQLRYESLHSSKSPSSDDPLQPQQQQNSDDSGISTTSSSPVNGTSANRALDIESAASKKTRNFGDRKTVVTKKPTVTPTSYVRSTSAAAFVFAPRNPKPTLPVEYYQGPKPTKLPAAASKNGHRDQTSNMLTRTVSTPQLFQSFQPKHTPTRGIMERFIATRGKLSAAAALASHAVIDNGPVPAANILLSPTAQIAPPVRDAEGKPLRKGFVPVEEKIQKELREMRHREVELKIQRQKSLQYDSNHNLIDDSKEDDSDFEDNFKLRSSKSISELSDFSPRDSPSPQLDNYKNHHRSAAYPEKIKLRPAMSLAQLCDLDPTEEVVSSNRLIAQWECMIQKKREVV